MGNGGIVVVIFWWSADFDPKNKFKTIELKINLEWACAIDLFPTKMLYIRKADFEIPKSGY